jgi:Fungal specific transcription factor domain
LPRNRLLANADLTVAHFYALRIYHFCCISSVDSAITPTIQKALSSILSIAQRIFDSGRADLFEWLDWPLFIAGVKTEDSIHREWVLGKLRPGTLRTALEYMLEAKENWGLSISVDMIAKVIGGDPLECGSTNAPLALSSLRTAVG